MFGIRTEYSSLELPERLITYYRQLASYEYLLIYELRVLRATDIRSRCIMQQFY